jgi:hypothetical protein
VRVIEDRVENYVPETKDNQDSDFKGTEQIDFWYLLTARADSGDLLLFFLGSVSSVIFGAALPSFCLIFGEMMDNLGASTSKNDFSSLKTSALY